MLTRTTCPQKTRELHNHHMDSTVWNSFGYRPGDIVIGTYAKSGTTWTQQIVAQLVFGGAEGVDVSALSPWLDLRIMPRAEMLAGLEAQTHRRFIKTHLPADALTFSSDAKYLYIGRDGRDVAWSAWNHFTHATDELFSLLNDTPGRVGPPLPRLPADIRRFFLEWLEGDGYPLWSFWENIRTWWALRDLANVKLIHFADLKADLPGQMRAIADFLGIEVAEERRPLLLHHCSFDYMKAHAGKVAPLGGGLWQDGPGRFIHKGTNGRWRDVLTEGDVARYLELAERNLGAECAAWLERGALG